MAIIFPVTTWKARNLLVLFNTVKKNGKTKAPLNPDSTALGDTV